MSRKRGRGNWTDAHERDPFVRRARREGWRSRAVFKLAELQDRYRLLRPGMTVVDLGAAPGGWSQFAADALKGRGRVLALDVLDMEPLEGVELIRGDFTDEAVLEALLVRLGETRVDLVICDMAPNISGVSSVDQPRAMYLAELALDFAQRVLAPGGGFVVKLFQGEGIEAFIGTARACFQSVRVRKPRASRPRSREVYMVAGNYRV